MSMCIEAGVAVGRVLLGCFAVENICASHAFCVPSHALLHCCYTQWKRTKKAGMEKKESQSWIKRHWMTTAFN